MRLSWIIGAALLVLWSSVAVADPDDCHASVHAYKNARREVAAALEGYGSCVQTSDGHDDCALEFTDLQSAQDEFASAVDDYETNCR